MASSHIVGDVTRKHPDELRVVFLESGFIRGNHMQLFRNVFANGDERQGHFVGRLGDFGDCHYVVCVLNVDEAPSRDCICQLYHVCT